jgi:hypothetical protein
MTEADSRQEAVRGTPRGCGKGLAWLIVTWLRLVVGLALVAEGGVLYAHARAHSGGPSWLVGMLAIVVGAALSLPGVYALYARGQSASAAGGGEVSPVQEQPIPMVGTLLVYKYGLITEDQLEKALERQRAQGEGKQLLGGILLDMGLVSMAELQTALAYQRSLRHGEVQASGPEEADQQPAEGVTEAAEPVESCIP